MMTKSEMLYRTPSNKWINDYDRYLAEWQKVISCWEKIGFQVISFDPGITLIDASHTDSPSFQVPMWASNMILKRVK